MTSAPILYDYWRSSASYRVRIALGLKGIDYKRVNVDLLEGENTSPEFLARNPQGLVPALEIDGHTLTQSVAIIHYLDRRYPKPRLIPADPFEEQRVLALTYAIAMEIHPICNLSVVNKVGEITNDKTQKVAWMRHFIIKGLTSFEAMLDTPETGIFCHGDTPSLADCCLIPQVYNAKRWSVDLTAMPRISRIYETCTQHDAFIKAAPETIAAA